MFHLNHEKGKQRQISASSTSYSIPFLQEMNEAHPYGGRGWLLFLSCSVTSNSLWPRGLQHARLPLPSLSPGVCSNSSPLSRWCHPTISSSFVPFLSCLQSFSARVFSNESALHIRWPEYWSFSFSISRPIDYLKVWAGSVLLWGRGRWKQQSWEVPIGVSSFGGRL